MEDEGVHLNYILGHLIFYYCIKTIFFFRDLLVLQSSITIMLIIFRPIIITIVMLFKCNKYNISHQSLMIKRDPYRYYVTYFS